MCKSSVEKTIKHTIFIQRSWRLNQIVASDCQSQQGNKALMKTHQKSVCPTSWPPHLGASPHREPDASMRLPRARPHSTVTEAP